MRDRSGLAARLAIGPLVSAITLGIALSDPAFAQQISAKEQIVGAWTLVSVASEMDDGIKGEPFGPSPKGVIIFSNDGHFSLFQSRAEIPKIAANDRAKATPEEAPSIVASSIPYRPARPLLASVAHGIRSSGTVNECDRRALRHPFCGSAAASRSAERRQAPRI